MLPRSMRTGAFDLPGVESTDVPLIGYRPLSPDNDTPGGQSGRGNANNDPDASQVDPSPMKSTWYCPLDLSTVAEEEEDGIIYTVVVKPHPITPNRTLSTSGSRSQCVKAGTEEKLVRHLLHSFSMGDSSFIAVFLATYRSFTSTQRVLDILIDRLENPPGDSERSHTRQPFNQAVSMVFGTWLSEYPEDFLSLRGPAPLLRLAPLLPRDSSPGVDLRARILHIAEGLSEKALLAEPRYDQPPAPPPPDSSIFEATRVLGFPAGLVAEQLTRMETELFVRLVPYHCLGSLWSQRDKKGHEGLCWSVRATVRQFNRLANVVLASSLCPTRLRSQQRARLLEKWISVAEECRIRKNFSSLYAIVSALRSNPLHRLRRAWQETDREAVRRYEELSEIFSDKDNYAQSRVLLKGEGTAKFANHDHRGNNRNRQPGASAQGTVPYLGIFLTDLTMLDTAVKDTLENGYINFDKRRREFEVLAQIRLLQSSCKNCVFWSDQNFVDWYWSAPTLTEEESYRLSNEIEAPGEPSPRGTMPTVIITECPSLSASRTSLASDSDATFDFPSPVNQLLSKFAKQHMKSPSVSCLDVDTSPPTIDSTAPSLAPATPVKSHRRSVSCGNNPSYNNSQSSGPDMRIIRIRMDLQDGNLYRSILVTSNDKTPAVVSSALEKHSQNAAETSRYELIQLLPEGKELIIPATGNVFYAMTSSSVDFLLRRKGGKTPLGTQPISTETSATFPRIKAKGRRLVRTLF